MELRNKLSNLKAQAVCLVLALPAIASATTTTTPDAAFTSAMDAVETNVGTFAAGLVGVAAIAVGFMVAIKYIKKLPRAS